MGKTIAQDGLDHDTQGTAGLRSDRESRDGAAQVETDGCRVGWLRAAQVEMVGLRCCRFG